MEVKKRERVDPDTPIEETVGAMSDLVKAGKEPFIGLSEGVNVRYFFIPFSKILEHITI